MTNLLNVNIMAEEVMRQQESEAAAKQTPTTKFDVKNYLNTRLADNEVTNNQMIGISQNKASIPKTRCLRIGLTTFLEIIEIPPLCYPE